MPGNPPAAAAAAAAAGGACMAGGPVGSTGAGSEAAEQRMQAANPKACQCDCLWRHASWQQI